MFKFSKFFRNSAPVEKEDDGAKELLKVRYQAFQKLLTTNNQVLELMADMEEKLSGEYLFDMQYIKTNVRLIGYAVSHIIENLNSLSRGKYEMLLGVHDRISKQIETILEYKLEIPVSKLAIPLSDLSKDEIGIAGGKMANLGEVGNRLGIPTPEGYVISAHAFIKFLDYNRLAEKIRELLSSVNIDNLEKLDQVSKDIRDLILDSKVPEELREAIVTGYARMCKQTGEKSRVSVRSSAIREDTEFSFAGQYATFLNIPGEEIVDRYRQVVASLFTPRAIFYSKTKGFSEEDMVMAVGVLRMVDASAGGVMYTRDPNDPAVDRILISGIYGLGKPIVDGTATPQHFVVSRHPAGSIVERRIPDQTEMLVPGGPEGITMQSVPDEKKTKPCISEEEIRQLASYGMLLEEHYGAPQDVEWAVEPGGKIYILQSRKLKSEDRRQSAVCLPTRFGNYPIILDRGVIACKGVGSGKAFVLKDEEDLKNFPDGGVLIAKHTSPKFVTVMNKAAAIVTDVGSATGHMASLSREYQIPTILDTEISTGIIPHGQEITVDAFNCNVYEGRVAELLEYARNRKEPFKDTHLFKTLEKVLKSVVPLNLTDPVAENFSPEHCRTFHDITRFSHEIAMREMFGMGEEQDAAEGMAIHLSAGIPVEVQLIDIEGGVREGVKKATFDDVLSIPFRALLTGMKSMKWPGPPPVDARGFFGMIAHAASVPEEQVYEAGKRSFAVVSGNYVNFSIRLGYHFSMIEAYAAENINDNYIKFFFKGGGAAIDRRLRRVRLITEILKKMGFRVSIKEDVIDAILTKYRQTTIEEKLQTMGKLTAYTKQLDMAMFNDAITDMYIDEFVKSHIPSPAQG